MELEKPIIEFSKEELMKWLRNLGLSVSGTKEELLTRIRKYERYPNLIKKLKIKATRNYSFPCSLDPLNIPPSTANWKVEDSSFPIITNDQFYAYASNKKEGSQGQQEKAYRMLQSRKIVVVKVLTDEGQQTVFVKAMIKKSYGQESRPAVIFFQGLVPKKAHCNCPVGASGLCCHVLALLLFLKHYTDTKEKLLELTCTEQLQKWHRRTTKGSIPMIPLKDIKLRSAKMRKQKQGIIISAADSEKSFFKRNVSSIIDDLNKKLQEEKPVTDHFYSVLSQSEIGRTSSLGEHLCYKYNLAAANSLADHNYAKTTPYATSCINVDPDRVERIYNYIDKENESVSVENNFNNNTISNLDIVLQENMDIVVENYTTVYPQVDSVTKQMLQIINKQITQDTNSCVHIDISFMQAPKACGTNYIDIAQNTTLWHKERRFKITGSRLPSLLGFYGQKKFDTYWEIVINGTNESKLLSGIENIRRGHEFEEKGVSYFELMSKAKTEKCGFFKYPGNERYGASPDSLGPAGLLLEVKTRAVNSDGPLKSLDLFPNYFVQCQLQMACTDANFCILLSYHPESESGNFFLIKRDSVLMNAIIEICDSVLQKEKIIEWNHTEIHDLKLFGKKIVGYRIDFDNLKPFRTYIKKCTKSVRSLEFIDAVDMITY